MMDILSRLYIEGNYEHLLLQIFINVDGLTLERCTLVNKTWNKIAKHIFKLKLLKRHLPSFSIEVKSINTVKSRFNESRFKEKSRYKEAMRAYQIDF